MILSVIIPMYNCENFIARAIESVLIQKEVDEIVLIDDCSPDNAVLIAQEYSDKYPAKITLIKLERNAGAAQARNVGIKAAKGDIIAFLDADDYYLPNRFEEALEILKNNPKLDGVYGSLGVDFETEELKNKYGDRFSRATTVYGEVKPETLFYRVHSSPCGWIHLNTLVVKKELIERCGYFWSKLREGQDTHLIQKLMAMGLLERQSIDIPIAMRGIHQRNRITKSDWHYHLKIVPDILEWGKDISIIQENKKILVENLHMLYMRLNAEKSYKLFRPYIFIFNLIKYRDIVPHEIIFSKIQKTILLIDVWAYIRRYPFCFFQPAKYKSLMDVISSSIE